MRFDLTIKDYTTEDIKNWSYDTSTNTIKDENNETIIHNGEFVIENNKPKEKKIAIQLGFSCNMSCSYCLQSKTKRNKFNIEQCNNIVEELGSMDLSNSRIEFWGGEPLLYFKEIVYILKQLKNKFRKLNKNDMLPSGYLIITNGMLLTTRIVKFLIKNNFTVVVSHDAQGQDIRGKNPLENDVSLEAIKYLYNNHRERFSFNSVITGNNINTEDRLKYFAGYLGIEDLSTIPHGGEGPVYNSKLDLLNIETMGDDIYLDILNGMGIHYGYYNSAISMFMKNLGNKKLENITTKCGIDNKDYYKVISIDGKELSCHNYDFKFDIQTLQNSDKCLKCPVVQLCKSSCPAIEKDSEVFKKNCEIMFASNLAILRSIIYILSGYKYQLIEIKEI